MITIIMANVKSKVDGLNLLPDTILYEIIETLSYTKKVFGVKPNPECLYNINNNTTFTGLIPHIIKILKKYNVQYNIMDKRQKPVLTDLHKINPNFQARDYQQDIIDRASSREICQAATGA